MRSLYRYATQEPSPPEALIECGIRLSELFCGESSIVLVIIGKRIPKCAARLERNISKDAATTERVVKPRAAPLQLPPRTSFTVLIIIGQWIFHAASPPRNIIKE